MLVGEPAGIELYRHPLNDNPANATSATAEERRNGEIVRERLMPVSLDAERGDSTAEL